MGLLRIDDKNNIEINLECLIIKDFRDLYDSIPDAKQRDKVFKYIYYVSDPNSRGVKKGLQDHELHVEALSQFEMREDWEPSRLVLDCIKYYKEEINGVGTNLLITLIRAFETNNKLVSKLNELVERDLAMETLNDGQIDALTARSQKILDIGTKLPDQLDKLKKAKELSILEQKQGNLARGNAAITPSMKTN